jgi:hypothetical protein
MKDNFVTHVLSLGGKKARTTARKPLIGTLFPSYKRRVTMSAKGFRAKSHRKNPSSYFAKRTKQVYYQGDRISQGKWSDKRWATAKKRDAARNGSKYEKWERKQGKPHTYNKKTSWK